MASKKKKPSLRPLRLVRPPPADSTPVRPDPTLQIKKLVGQPMQPADPCYGCQKHPHALLLDPVHYAFFDHPLQVKEELTILPGAHKDFLLFDAPCCAGGYAMQKGDIEMMIKVLQKALEVMR